ncbi:hypothetical protein MKW92_030204 [Papaver armeniacum]|nr:hypothetical protein MKW92_030204 [Papaver armeniacum]
MRLKRRYFQLLFTTTIFFFLASTLSSVSSITTTTSKSNSTSSCPIDMSYVNKIPWDNSGCKNTTRNQKQQQTCCQTLLSLFGVGLSTHLKQTGYFHLPTHSAAASCVNEFQSNLNSLSLPSDISSTCFGNPDRFVISPNICAGIQNTTDWISALGTSTLLDSSCGSDLSVLTSCDSCVAAGFKVQSKLMTIDRNTSHAMDCFYFAVLYAAGIANRYGPENFDTASCIFGLTIINNSSNGKKNHHSSVAFAVAGASVAVLGVICSLLGFLWWRRYQLQKRKKADEAGGLDSDQERSSKMKRPNTGSIWFKIKDLERATDNFSQKNMIGRGGFGIVYKGTLSDGSLVAVKKMIESDFQGNAEFCNEVEIISNLKHRNLVPLRGCCVTGDGEDGEEVNGSEQMRYLVYDFMPNGNLDDHLFLLNNKKKALSWPERKSIILDVAKGLAYLHYGVKPSIYHRDIKATNILLDSEMKARVADFGLAKQNREGQSHLTTRVAGTHGYLAPEYALYGQLTEKSDIYSFGIVILEIMSGRRALDLNSLGSPTSVLITDWAWTLVKSGETDRVFDETLLMLDDGNNNSNPKGIMERFVMVGILCAHVMVALRPTILDALKMLEGDIEVPPLPDRPLPLSHRSFCSNGNTFSSLSTTSTTPLQFNPGDMLR